MCWPRSRWCSASPSACASPSRARAHPGVTPKDMILHLIGQIGTAGGTGYAVEYAGSAIRALEVEGRLTICNLSIELGAKIGMIAPDEKTFDFLKGRPYAPTGALWDQAVADWRSLAERRRRGVRRRGHGRREQDRAADHLGHQPRACHPRHRHRARSGDGRRSRQAEGHADGARLHGPEGGHADPGREDRLGVHRLVHQQPHVRPARRRRDRQGPQGGGPCPRLGRAGLGEHQAPGRGRGASTASSWRPASNGASPAARCAWRSTATPSRRASGACRPPTATSSAARDRAGAPISPARRWPRPPPSPAASPTSVRSRGQQTMEAFTELDAMASPADAPERRHRHHHPDPSPARRGAGRARALRLRAAALPARRQRQSGVLRSTSPPTRAPQIVVADNNFACGSSPRGRGVGADGHGHPRRHRAVVRADLLQQLLPERRAADPARPRRRSGHRGRARGRDAARRQQRAAARHRPARAAR